MSSFSIPCVRWASAFALIGVLVDVWLLPAGSARGEAVDGTRVVHRVLHRFPSHAFPSELIQSTDGNLYGVTNLGGAFGRGTFYSLDAHGSATVLHDFGDHRDGYSPYTAPLEAPAGTF